MKRACYLSQNLLQCVQCMINASLLQLRHMQLSVNKLVFIQFDFGSGFGEILVCFENSLKIFTDYRDRQKGSPRSG